MKLNNFLEKLNNVKGQIALSATRKQALKSKLLYLIDLREKTARPARAFFFPILRPMPIMAGVAVFVLLGAGVSFGAEGAVPGDILYPIKVSVNEELVGVLKLTPAAKAQWEAARIERRLEEVNKLALADTTEDKDQEKLEARLEEHTNRVEGQIAVLEQKGNVQAAVNVASKVETSFRAHEQVLEKIKNKKTAKKADKQMEAMTVIQADTNSSPTLQEKLDARLTKIGAARMALEAKIAIDDDMRGETRIDAAAKMKTDEVRRAIDAIRAYIKDHEEKLSIQSIAQAEEALKRAEEALDEAKARFDNNLSGEAFNLGNEALSIVGEAKVHLRAKVELDINGDDDEPVGMPILNPEEQKEE